MSDIQQAVDAYVAAADLANPAALVGLRTAIESRALVQATQTVGRIAGHVNRAGGKHANTMLAHLNAVGQKLTQAHSHHAQLMTLLDELVSEFMSLQGQLSGIAAEIAATGEAW